MFLAEYFGILVAFLIGFVLAFVFWFLSYVLIYREYNVEKLSAYECGFGAFEDSRDLFDIRFYLVAILFLVFDLEIIYLFPWCVALAEIGLFGFIFMFFFLVLLLFGFFYEWKKGALDW